MEVYRRQTSRISTQDRENEPKSVVMMEDTKKEEGGTLSTSTPSSSLVKICEETWPRHRKAWHYFSTLLSLIYGLLMMAIVLVVEIGAKYNDEQLIENLFFLYMYGFAYLFMGYLFAYVIRPKWCRQLVQMIVPKTLQKRYSLFTAHGLVVDSNDELYLRIGAIMFGLVGVVTFSIEIVLCYGKSNDGNSEHYDAFHVPKMAATGVFLLLQIYLIVRNSNLIFFRMAYLAKLGIIHLAVVNLWQWFKFVNIKQTLRRHHHEIFLSIIYNITQPPGTEQHMMTKMRVFNEIEFSSMFVTCLVEFSLISAAMLVALWLTLDDEKGLVVPKQKKQSKVSIDYKSTGWGFTAGLLLILIVATIVGMHYSYAKENQWEKAQLAYQIGNLIAFSSTMLGCLFGLYQMTNLHYIERHSPMSEMVDDILMCVGLMGELLYCLVAIHLYIIDQWHESQIVMWGSFSMGGIDLALLIIRLLGSCAQTLCVYMGGRLYDKDGRRGGRQSISFLIISNATIFFFTTIQNLTADDLFTKQPDESLLLAIAYPLTVFFRCHSSMCLAEIWSASYTEEDTPESPSVQLSVTPRDFTRSQLHDSEADTANVQQDGSSEQ